MKVFSRVMMIAMLAMVVMSREQQKARKVVLQKMNKAVDNHVLKKRLVKTKKCDSGKLEGMFVRITTLEGIRATQEKEIEELEKDLTTKTEAVGTKTESVKAEMTKVSKRVADLKNDMQNADDTINDLRKTL